MITEKETIRCEAVFDDTKSYRYMWKRVWDKTKPSVVVVMLHPCFSDNILADTTTNLVVNNVMRLGIYGGVCITNLYAKMTDKMLFRWDSQERLIGSDNDEFIRKAALEVEDVILAWGVGADKIKSVVSRIASVVSLLKEMNKNLYSISDGKRVGLHPLTPSVRSKWILQAFSERDAVVGATLDIEAGSQEE